MGVIDDVLKNKNLEDLVIDKSVKTTTPSLTTEKVEEAITLLKEVEKNNGHIAIASTIGLTRSQVAEIHRKMDEKIESLREPIEPVEL